MLVLKYVAASPLQHSGTAATETRRVFAKLRASAAGFDADHSHVFVGYELMKQANRVAAAAYASDQQIRQAPLGFENLHSGFATYHRLKIANHYGVRMRSHH